MVHTTSTVSASQPLTLRDSLLTTPAEDLVDQFSLEDIRNLRAEQNQRIANLPFVQDEQGVGQLMRAALGTASDTEGQMNILRNYGFEPVMRDGQLSVVKEGKAYPVNVPGMDLGDIFQGAGEYGPQTIGGIGGALFSGAGGPLTATLGAAAGSAAGEGVRQTIGQQLGSGEGIDPAAITTEGAWGAAGELPFARPLRAIVNRALAPLKPTSRITGKAREIDELVGTDIEGKLPLSAQSDLPSIQTAEAYLQKSPVTATDFEQKVRQPLQQEFSTAMERIHPVTEGVGRRETGEAVMESATETLRSREKQVAQLYDELTSSLPPNAAVEPWNSVEALISIRDLTGAGGPAFHITKQLRDQLTNLEDDVLTIKTISDLDTLRRGVGEMLKSHGAMEQFANTGLDKHIRRLYGAILADGQVVAQQYGQGELEHLARRSAGEIIDIDKSSVSRALKDPLQAENIIDKVFKPNQTVAYVKMFKQKLGAVPTTETGLTTTAEGETAWSLMSDVLMQRIAKNSADPRTNLMSGDRMFTALEKSGGRDILSEAFGKETTDNLYKLADVMRDSNISERIMGNYSGTAAHQQIADILAAAGSGPEGWLSALGRWGATKGLGNVIMSPAEGRGRKWLTKGLLQSPAEQKAVQAGVTAIPQGGSRAIADALGMGPQDLANMGLIDFEEKDDLYPTRSTTRRLYHTPEDVERIKANVKRLYR